MNARQKSKLSMYLAVKNFLTTFAAIVTTLPNFSEFFAAFIKAIPQIQTFSEHQKFDKSGLKKNKNLLKIALATLTADASRKFQAYAGFIKNQLLLSQTKLNESELKKASGNELINYAQGIYDLAQANLAALEPYGINAETQQVLLNAINAFIEAIPAPRIGSADSAQNTRQLAIAIAEADASLKNMDALVEIVKLSQPAFYNEYFSLRKPILSGKGSLAVKGTVIDANTGKPIKNAVLSFVLNGNGNGSLAKSVKVSEAIIKKTAEKGGFNLKSLAPGNYHVTITKNGYPEQVTSISVTGGESTDLNIQL